MQKTGKGIILREIGFRLQGIAKDDLTRAEGQIVDILIKAGVVVFAENEDSTVEMTPE